MHRRQLLRAAAFGGAALLADACAQASYAASGPTPPMRTRDSPLAARDRRADLALIDRIYRDMHPGLARCQTLAQWGAAVSAADAAWASRSKHRLDAAYLDLSRLLAHVRCGHSHADFYNRRPAVAQALFAGRDKLPLTFTWLGDRLVVTGGTLRAGTDLLAIDGTPVAHILARLLPLVRTDGRNDAKQRALLSVDARAGLETFDILHALTAGAREGFLLDVREPGREARRVELPAIDLLQRRAMNPLQPVPASDAAPPWTLSYDHERNAVLTMPGWAL